MNRFITVTKRMTALLLLLAMVLPFIPLHQTISLAETSAGDLSTEYADAISYLVSNGFADDYTYGPYDPFDPDAYVCRNEMICTLYRMSYEQGGQNENPFLDVEEDVWFADAAKWCSTEQIIAVPADGMLQPYDAVTHGEMLEALWNFCNWYERTCGVEVYYDSSFSVDEYYSSTDCEEDYVYWAMSNGLVARELDDDILTEILHGKDLALYAARFQKFVVGMDEASTYAFADDPERFVSDERYLMNRAHYEKYLSYAANISQVKFLVDRAMQTYNGSGVGMAISAALDKSGKLAFNELVTNNTYGAVSMRDLVSPDRMAAWQTIETEDAFTGEKISLLESALNFYQLTSYILDWNDSYGVSQKKLEQIVETQRKDGIGIVCANTCLREGNTTYSNVFTGVLHGYPRLINGYYEIDIYDPNESNIEKTLAIMENYSKCHIRSGDKTINVLSLNYSDIGACDDLCFDLQTGTHEVGNPEIDEIGDDVWLYVSPSVYDFYISNSSGEGLEFSHEEIRGDLELFDERYFEDALKGMGTFAFQVSDSDEYTIGVLGDRLSSQLVGGGRYAGVTGTNIETVRIGTDSIVVIGKDMDLCISSSFGCDSTRFIRVNASNEDLVIIQENDGVPMIYTENPATAEIVCTDPDVDCVVLEKTTTSWAYLYDANTSNPWFDTDYLAHFKYADVSAAAYPEHMDAINYVLDNHIMAGKTDETFGPDVAATLGDAIRAVFSMAGSPESEYYGSYFRDVLPMNSNYPAVNWARCAGIVLDSDGMGGLLRPGRELYMGKALTFLWRYNEWSSENSETELYYDDIVLPSVSAYDYGEMDPECLRWALSNGFFTELPEADVLDAVIDRKELARLLAVYCENVEGIRERKDRNGFTDDSANFISKGRYYLTEELYNKYLSLADSNSHAKYLADMWQTTTPNTRSMGMAVTAVLDKQGKIAFNENVAANAATLFEVPNPKQTTDADHVKVSDYRQPHYWFTLTEALINYYELVWNVIGADQTIQFTAPTVESLKNIVNKQKQGGTAVFSYVFIDKEQWMLEGHTIALTGHAELTNEDYEIRAYDPRSIDMATLVISKDFTSCVVRSNGEVTPTQFAYLDGDLWDASDVDGEYNVLDLGAITTKRAGKAGSKVETVSDDTWIYLSTDGQYQIDNASGESVQISLGDPFGDLPILNQYFIGNGPDTPATLALKVEGSEEFTISTFTEDNTSVYVAGGGRYAGITGTGVDKIVVGESHISVTGEDITATLTASFDPASDDYVRISTDNTGHIAAIEADEGLYIDSYDSGAITVLSTNPSLAKTTLNKRNGTVLLLENEEGTPVLGYPSAADFEYADLSGDFSKTFAYAFDAINYACNNGLIRPDKNGNFSPYADVTNAEVIYALYEHDNAMGGYMGNSFKDVDPDAWYHDSVSWGVYAGILSDKTSSYFYPDRFATFGDVLTFMWKRAMWCGIDYYDETIDMKEYYRGGDYSVECIRWAISNGLINLQPNPNSTPQHTEDMLRDSVTRTFFAQLISLYSQNVDGIRDIERHSFENFCSYRLSKEHYEKYLSFATSSYNEKYLADRQRDHCGGCCYGWSVSCFLDKTGQIAFNENFAINAKTLSNVPKRTDLEHPNQIVVDGIIRQEDGSDDSEKISLAQSAVSYHQLIWQTHQHTRYCDTSYLVPTEQNLNEILEYHKNGGVAVFYYFVGKDTRHAVVLTGRPEHIVEEDKNGNTYDAYLIEYQDPNDYRYYQASNSYPEYKLKIIPERAEAYLVINGNTTKLNTIQHVENPDQWDIFDIDGTYNESVIDKNAATAANITDDAVEEGTILYFKDASVDFEVTDSSGKTLIYEDGEFSGTMELLTCKMIPYGPDVPASIMVTVAGSSTYTFTTLSDEASFYVCGGGRYAGIEGKGIESATITTTKLTAVGSNMDVRVASSFGCAENQFMEIKATNESSVSVGMTRGILQIATKNPARIETIYTDYGVEGVVEEKPAGTVKVFGIETDELAMVSLKPATRLETYFGSCGEEATWSFDAETGTLTISGNGPMKDYDWATEGAPWDAHREKIQNIVIEDGITLISEYVFSDLQSLTAVTIPASVTAVADHAFFDCNALRTVTFAGKTPTAFGNAVFDLCADDFTIHYNSSRGSFWAPNGETTWNGYSIEPLDLILLGDINLDGDVSSADAAALLRAIVSMDRLNDRQLLNVDVDGDGRISAADAAHILRTAVGLN